MTYISNIKKKYANLPIQVKASLWFLICSFLQKAISTITTPIFTRLLNTAEYGRYSVFNSWLSILTIFVSFSLAGGVYSQGLVKFESQRAVFSSTMQGLSAALVAVWTVIYLLFRNFWNQIFSLTTVQMLAMLVMIWTTAVFNFWAAEQRVCYRYKALVLLTLGVSLAKPIIGIVFVVLAEDKVTARILGLVLVELIAYTSLFFVQVRRGKKLFSSRFWKYAICFNLPLLGHYLSQTVLSGADRIMIEYMQGSEEAGIYSLAYSLSLIMTFFNTALMGTLSPWIYQKIKEQKISDIAPVGYLSLICIAAVSLMLIAFAPELVAIFAPKEYHDAIWIVPPVAMSVYFMYSYDLFAKFAFYYEKTRFIMVASVIGAVLNIVLNAIFIKPFGFIAAGYTTLICYIVYSTCHYIFMNRVCKTYCDGQLPYNMNKVLIITIPFVLVGLLLLVTYNFRAVRYGIILIALLAGFLKRNVIIDAGRRLIAVKKQKNN